MSLLAPLFLTALAAVAVPILVHLTARDRRDVVRFPSLKFLTRLPYRQVRRQRIRHPVLFALRTLAILLLVLAFCRPLFEGASAAAGGEGGREVVIALDASYSMSYGGTWERALTAARQAVAALSPTARVSLLVFAEEARILVPPTTGHASVAGALDTLRPGAGQTRFTPVLQSANEILLESPFVEREVVLISDFQARAWDRSARTQLLPATVLTPVDLATAEPANVTIAGVDVRRGAGEDGPAMVLTVRLVSQGAAVGGLPVTLGVAGEDVASERVSLAASGGAAVRLGPVREPPDAVPATVTIGDDRLAADNVFHLTLAPRRVVPVLLVVARDARGDAALYLSEALALAEEPAFDVLPRTVDQVRPEDVEAASVVILHDTPFPGGAARRALAERVAAGGGLWVVLGSRSAVPDELAELLPGGWRDTVDRLDVQGVSLASVDYDHPVFEVFSGADDGNVAGPRFYRYRPLVLDEDGASRAIARYTDGAVALAEGRHGDGRVLLWGSSLDNRWSNLPVQPIFLPFVHQVSQFLGDARAAASWREVGQALNVAELLAEIEIETEGAVVVESPSGVRTDFAPGTDEPLVALDEAGFYQVTVADTSVGDTSYPVAVNADRAESDLTRLDPEAFVAASTVAPDPSAPASAGARSLPPAERERRQGAWWYLMAGALLFLAAESLWSNRPGQGHPSPTRQRISDGPAID